MSDPQLPSHIAVIMDGNGRWAEQRNKPRSFGHQAGVDATRKLIRACLDQKIPFLTIFAFSSENWQRPKREVGILMELFLRSLKQEMKQLNEAGVKLCFIGDIVSFSPALQLAIKEAETSTMGNDRLHLQIAVSYGGRWDVTQAVTQLVAAVNAGEILLSEINEETLSAFLSTRDVPDPDLFIRSGGEMRLSNYLLWQLAYSELYFTPCLWPDFDESVLQQALTFYAGRQRRFGKVNSPTGEANNA